MTARSVARTASPANLSRAHVVFRGCLVIAIIFPHTKWLTIITDYRDTAALSPKPSAAQRYALKRWLLCRRPRMCNTGYNLSRQFRRLSECFQLSPVWWTTVALHSCKGTRSTESETVTRTVTAFLDPCIRYFRGLTVSFLFAN